MPRKPRAGTSLPKKAAISVLSPAILTPLVSAGLLASPAGAGTQDTVFDIGGGTTCILRATRTLPVGGDPKLGRGTTTLLAGSGPNIAACTSNVMTAVTARWDDPDGFASGTLGKHEEDSSVTALFAPIGSNFETNHQAFSGFCNCFSPFVTLTK